MKQLLLTILLFISTISFTQTLEIKKCNNNDTDFDMHIHGYPNEIIVNVGIDDNLTIGEFAVFDTSYNVLYSKTSEQTRVTIRKSILLNNKIVLISYRSKHYIIRKRYIVE